MARVQNDSLKYFPMTTEWDQKMKLVRARFKMVGVGCMVELWKAIYHEGYALKWDSDSELLFADENSIDIEVLRDIVSFAVSKGIFDQGILESKGYLTSHGIQKQWIAIVNSSKRKNTTIDDSLCLLDENERSGAILRSISSDGGINSGVNAATDDKTPEEIPQSKLKQIKLNESSSYARADDVSLEDPGLLAYALERANKAKARSPEAYAHTLIEKPEVRAAYLASLKPQAQPEAAVPDLKKCPCGEKPKVNKRLGEAFCICGRTWTYDPDFRTWDLDRVEDTG